MGTYDHSAVLLHSNNMLILVISFVVVLFVPSCAGKTNIIGMYKCMYVANLNCFQVTEWYMYMYVASPPFRPLNRGEMT